MADDKKPMPTVSGSVTDKDKPLWQRIYGFIFADSIENVRRSVLTDIVGPYVKDFFYDLFTGSIEKSIYGSGSSSRRANTYRGSNRAPVRGGYTNSYEAYYHKQPSSDIAELYAPVIMRSRPKCQEVYDILLDRIRECDEVTINDLNSCLIDEDGNSRIGKVTDPYWGWKSLPPRPNIRQITLNQWQLILPEPVELGRRGDKRYYEV